MSFPQKDINLSAFHSFSGKQVLNTSSSLVVLCYLNELRLEKLKHYSMWQNDGLLQNSINSHSNLNSSVFSGGEKSLKLRLCAPCNIWDYQSHFYLLEVISVCRIKAKAHQQRDILIPNETLVSFSWGGRDC